MKSISFILYKLPNAPPKAINNADTILNPTLNELRVSLILSILANNFP